MPQPCGIRNNPVWHGRVDEQTYLRFFVLRRTSHQQHRTFHHIAQVGRNELDLELVSLNLGDVKNVVQYVEQCKRRTIDGVEHCALLVTKLGVLELIYHAQDAIHWRADFMAHIGQKLSLGAACCVRDFLSILSYRDVCSDRNVFEWLSTGVIEQGDSRINPEKAAVFALVAHFCMPRLACGNGVEHVFEEPLGVNARIQDEVVFSHHFCCCIPGYFEEFSIRVGDSTRHVGHGDDGVFVEHIFLLLKQIERVLRLFGAALKFRCLLLNQIFKLLSMPVEIEFRHFSCCDVFVDTQNAEDFSFCVSQRYL